MHDLPSGYFWSDTGFWGLAVVLLAPESYGPCCRGGGVSATAHQGAVDGAGPWVLCASEFCTWGTKRPLYEGQCSLS